MHMQSKLLTTNQNKDVAIMMENPSEAQVECAQLSPEMEWGL